MSKVLSLCFFLFALVLLTGSSAEFANAAEPTAEELIQQRKDAAAEAMRAVENVDEKTEQEARARMAQRVPVVQAEIKQLYDGLLAMRNTAEFKQLGFSAKNTTSTAWKGRVESLRERLEGDSDVPLQLKAAPAYMLTLGMEKAWRDGKTTDMSKWNTQMVMDALNWKLEE